MQVESSIKHLPESHTDEQCGTELQKKKKRERDKNTSVLEVTQHFKKN